MADIKTLFDAIAKLKLPERRPTPEEMGMRVREALRDDRRFEALLREMAAPRSYTPAELSTVYNIALGRSQRFARNVSKRKILEQLADERLIMLENDEAGRVIKAHS